MSNRTTHQTDWGQEQDPGVVTRLDEIIAMLHSRSANIGSTDRTGNTASSSLSNILPAGTTWNIPTLQRFNEYLGAIGITGATPLDVTEFQTFNPGQTGQLTYTVPSGKVAMAMGPGYGYLSRHSPDIEITGYLDYGLPDFLQITESKMPGTRDFIIDQAVMGSHPLQANVVVEITNHLSYTLDFTMTTVLLVIDQDLWDSIYQPIFRQALRAWIERLASNASVIGGEVT